MKKNLILGVVSIILLASFFTYIFKFQNSEKQTLLTINQLHKKHAYFLKTSPFKKSLQLSEEQREENKIPPNKYYEREWELTMNPAIGRPEPEKVLTLQNRLKQKKLFARNPGDAVDNNWTERGPNNIGGRTRVLLFDPNDATHKRVFAGGVSGGLWVNQDITNPNSTWTSISSVPGNMNISCITVDPRNSNIWYLGTGEQYTFGAAVGNGVYKSTDGGNSWINLTIQLAGGGNFLYNSTNTFLAGIYFINSIKAWDNGTSTEVFIGVGSHTYNDSNNPTDWLGMQSAGLYRTTDNGASWSRVESSNMSFTNNGQTYYYIPNDIEISANNTLWMATIATPYLGNGGGHVYSSIDGTTWNSVTTLANSNRVELALSASNPDKIYALTEGTTSAGPHIYVTTDSFSTVTELAKPIDADTGIPSGDFTRGQDFYDLVIAVDPSNDQTFYVGGIDLFRSTSGTLTNTTSDWQQISKWANSANLNTLSCSYVHADQHAFTFRPGNSDQAVIGCDGGVFYASSLATAQNNNVFVEMNKNYGTVQFYYGAYGQSTTNELIVGGAQDNGSPFINGAASGLNSATDINSSDGAYCAIDTHGNYMVVSNVYNYYNYYKLPYTGTGTGYIIDNNGSEGDFINAAALDDNLNILYTNGTNGTKKINRYVLGNSNSTKLQLTNVLLDGSPTAFKVSPFTTSGTTLLVGTDNGKLLKLTNANDSATNIIWEDITGSSFLGSISHIEFGKTENDIFVTFHNYGVISVWYTSDGGISWKNKEGNLPDMPVKCILQNPLASNEAIVGTELGIWATTSFNEDSPTWSRSDNGMKDVKVVDLDLRTADNSVLASTHGRGFFTGQFSNTIASTFTISTQQSVITTCKPNDAVFNFDFTALGSYATNTTFSVSGLPSGATAAFNNTSLSTTGTFALTISNIQNVASGTYILKVTGTGAKTISTDVVLKVNESSLGIVTLISFANAAQNIALTDNVFSWNSVVGATSYDFQLASDSGFKNIIENATAGNTTYTSSTLLNYQTVYYWRVRAKNDCVLGNFSETRSFQTVPFNNCNSFSNNTSVAIPDGVGAELPGSPAYSSINVSDNITVSDINVTIGITHTYINDLVISLIAPDNTEVVLFNRGCGGQNGINVTFDDIAASYLDCTEPITGTFKPANPLSTFNGKNSNGIWKLKAVDYYSADTGTIDSWSVEVCSAQTTTNSSFTNNIITVGTNSTYIIKQTDIEATSVGSTDTQQIYMLTQLPTLGELRLNNVTLSLGDTFTQADINSGNLTFYNTQSNSGTDFFKVDITNATGGFLPNQQVTISIDSALTVDNEFFYKTGITVFPTITEGELFISSKNELGKAKIEIFAITGQKVFSNSYNLKSGFLEKLNLTFLNTGVYIVKINSEKVQGSKKIIIK